VLKAVENINTVLAPALARHEVRDQAGIDRKLIEIDGTDNKARLGANALLAISLAAPTLRRAMRSQPLHVYLAQHLLAGSKPVMPVPQMNIINGGAHANNSLDIQEFMILPVGAPSFSEALRYGAEVFHTLKKILAGRGLSTAVGDEGGFAPDLASNEEALSVILQAIDKAGYKAGSDICLGLDVASSELFKDGQYELVSEKRRFSAAEFARYLGALASKYPIITIEDGMSEDDWQGWDLLTRELGKRVQLVGDDLFVTNTQILKRGIDEHIANAILIKPNQIGTLTETLAAIDMAERAKYKSVISHRSGETEDTTIADIAVASAATQIKTGSLSRSDRMAKYNQLLRIETELGAVPYAGRDAFPVKC
jgi:enolase